MLKITSVEQDRLFKGAVRVVRVWVIERGPGSSGGKKFNGGGNGVTKEERRARWDTEATEKRDGMGWRLGD